MRRQRNRALMHHVGIAIREERKAKGWRQVDLAEKAGCSRSTLACIESVSSDGGGSLEVLLDIASALGCHIGDLLPNNAEWKRLSSEEG